MLPFYKYKFYNFLKNLVGLILYSNLAKRKNMIQIPLPPLKMMVDINAQNNTEIFSISRVASVEQLKKDLLESGLDISELSEILDCGCGCGRVIAGWEMLGHRFRLHGCDYNKELVDWCQSNISTIEFKLIGLTQLESSTMNN
jgi:cyclopropane fatty-acyl-phospholipid synthase-like methyltransferase